MADFCIGTILITQPAIHSGVVNANTAFEHHLFNVTQAQRIGHVPPAKVIAEQLLAMAAFRHLSHRLLIRFSITASSKASGNPAGAPQ